MITRENPPTLPQPASNYVQTVVHGPGRRLIISGQVGVTPDGTLREGLQAQLEQAFDNLVAALAHHGAGPSQLLKITFFSTIAGPEAVAAYRTVRDDRFGGVAVASTYVVVAGLAHPGFLIEVEGEALLP